VRSSTSSLVHPELAFVGPPSPDAPKHRMPPASDAPKHQAPLGAFEETIGSTGSLTADDFFQSKRAASLPSPSPTAARVAHGQRSPERVEHKGSKERSKSHEVPRTEVERPTERRHSERPGVAAKASVRSVREATAKQFQHHNEAKKRWHEAFAEAAAKRAATPTKSPLGFFGPRGAGDAGQDIGMAGAEGTAHSKASEGTTHSKGSEGTGHSKNSDRHSSKASASTASTDPGRRQSKAGQESGQGQHPSSAGSDARSSSKAPNATATNDDPELQKHTQDVERKMRALIDAPIAERKRVLRELMLEYHPDKNSDPFAKEVFQFINASRGWFLCEA